MFDRYFFRQQVAPGSKIRFRLHLQWTPSVLGKRLITSGRRLHPNHAGVVKKIEQHLFMVSAQANYLFRILFAKTPNVFNAAGHVGTTIN